MMRSAIAFLFLASTNGLFFEKEKCYPIYGCFDNKSPYVNSNDVPVEPQKIGLQLALNNRVNPNFNSPEFLIPTDASSVNNSRFDASKKVVVIIHGFHGSFLDAWVGSLAQAILEADDVNVICVDWHEGAKTNNYNQATANTRLVGKMIAVMLTTIHNTMGTSYYDMHIIGHSLGSHIAGYVGRFIPGFLGRISGLDPAGPKFERYDSLVRLDTSDALFVDVIHSDDDTILELGWGTGVPMGDLDFYPNGGENQPGCSKGFWKYVSNLLFDFGELTEQVACSHMRAIYLYISSIRNTFIGRKCNSYDEYNSGLGELDTAIMGYWATSAPRWGKYYLKTTGVEPYV